MAGVIYRGSTDPLSINQIIVDNPDPSEGMDVTRETLKAQKKAAIQKHKENYAEMRDTHREQQKIRDEFITKSRNLHTATNQRIHQQVMRNHEITIQKIGNKLKSEQNKARAWQGLISGLGTIAQQKAESAAKEAKQLTQQKLDLLRIDGDISTEELTHVADLAAGEDKDGVKFRKLLEKQGYSPAQIRNAVPKSAKEAKALYEAIAIFKGDAAQSFFETEVYKQPLHNIGGKGLVDYRTLVEYIKSEKFKSGSGEASAKAIHLNAFRTMERWYKEKQGLNHSQVGKTYHKHIGSRIEDLQIKEALDLQKVLQKDAQGQMLKEEFDIRWMTNFRNKEKEFGYEKALELTFNDYLDTYLAAGMKPQEIAKQFAHEIHGYGLRSGGMHPQQTQKMLALPMVDKSKKSKEYPEGKPSTFGEIFPEAAEIMFEAIDERKSKSSKLWQAQNEEKKQIEDMEFNVANDNINKRFLTDPTFTYAELEKDILEIMKTNPIVGGRLYQSHIAGQYAAPIVNGKIMLSRAKAIIADPTQTLKKSWIDSYKFVDPGFRLQVINLWRENGGDGPSKDSPTYSQIKQTEEDITSLVNQLGGWEVGMRGSKDLHWTINSASEKAKAMYLNIRLGEWKKLEKENPNDPNNWLNASNNAWKILSPIIEDPNGEFAVTTDAAKYGTKKVMAHFLNRAATINIPGDNVSNEKDVETDTVTTEIKTNIFKTAPNIPFVTNGPVNRQVVGIASYDSILNGDWSLGNIFTQGTPNIPPYLDGVDLESFYMGVK